MTASASVNENHGPITEAVDGSSDVAIYVMAKDINPKDAVILAVCDDANWSHEFYIYSDEDSAFQKLRDDWCLVIHEGKIHWFWTFDDDHVFSKWSLLFNDYGDDKPRTYVDLKRWLMTGNQLHYGWSDRGTYTLQMISGDIWFSPKKINNQYFISLSQQSCTPFHDYYEEAPDPEGTRTHKTFILTNNSDHEDAGMCEDDRITLFPLTSFTME